MRLSCYEINQHGVVLDKLKMKEMTRKYSSQYARGCYILWSLGYISCPTYFDESDFLVTLPSDVVAMMNNKTTGDLLFTYEMIDFILQRSIHSDKYRISEDYTSVLKIARDVVEAKTALEDFAELSRTVRIPKRTDEIPVKTYLTVSHSVLNSGKAPLDSPFVQALIKIAPDEEFYELSFIMPVISNICKKIGYSLDKLMLHKDENKSVFLGKGFTFADDIRYFKFIQSGAIEGESSAGRKLFRCISEYYEKSYNETTTNTVCVRFERQNFMDSIDECIEHIRFKKETLKLKGYIIKYVNTFNIVYARKREGEIENPPLKSMFIGSFVYDNASGQRLVIENQLRGMSGEFVSKYSVKKKEYDALGLSVDMLDENGYENSYYPLICTQKAGQVGVVPLFAGYRKQKFRNIIAECKRLEVSSAEDIAREIAESIDVEYMGRSLNMLVGLLVQALICVECDYILDGHISSNQVLFDEDYSWLDEEGWNLVVRESAYLFRGLGFEGASVSA